MPKLRAALVKGIVEESLVKGLALRFRPNWCWEAQDPQVLDAVAKDATTLRAWQRHPSILTFCLSIRKANASCFDARALGMALSFSQLLSPSLLLSSPPRCRYDAQASIAAKASLSLRHFGGAVGCACQA